MGYLITILPKIMAQQMLYYLNCYNQKIQILRTYGDQLLESIQMLEIGMNRRKKQNEQPHLDEVNYLFMMATDLFGMLAEIKTCEYFKMTNQLVDFNEDFYKITCETFFRDLVKKFNDKLKAQRLNTNNQIDFSINA